MTTPGGVVWAPSDAAASPDAGGACGVSGAGSDAGGTTGSSGAGENVAVTESGSKSTKAHVRAVLSQAPLQPVKTEPAAGEAVSVMSLRPGRSPSHVAPHSMPPRLLVTDPLPSPAFVTTKCTGGGVNVAITWRSASSTSVQVGADPAQAPLQPAKIAPLPGIAVNVTTVPSTNRQGFSHGASTVIVPRCVPARERHKVRARAKVAVAAFASFIETTHTAAVPVHAPLQPVNIHPSAGTAWSVTLEPTAMRC